MNDFTRRQVATGLAAGGLLVAGGMWPMRIAHAALPTNKNFVFIIQRGAADGLSALLPLGDSALRQHRAAFIPDGTHKLDAMFALHPAFVETAKLYAGKQALFAHAIASSYRERSHFDAQNILETGGLAAYATRDGWMNRLIGLFGKTGPKAIAVSPTVPLALRGNYTASSYAASTLPDANEDLLQRVAGLYEADAPLHNAYAAALENRASVGSIAQVGQNGKAVGTLAARLMTGREGARLLMIETTGWDTHNQQSGRLNNQFKNLDAMIASLKAGLGATWNSTMVLVATEFGRTVAINGTAGSDHGTASAAMIFGGGVKGGRILADWPGLGQSALYEGRDLKPTATLEGLIAGAIASHFRLDPELVARTLYPAHRGLKTASAIA